MTFLQKLRYFVVHSLPHILVSISMLIDSRSNSVWYKTSIQFFSAFIFSLSTRRLWHKLNLYSGTGSKEQENSRRSKTSLFPRKARTIWRLFITSILFLGNTILFNYAMLQNSLSNGIILILIRIFATFTTGGFNFSGKYLDVAASAIIFLSILVTTFKLNLNIFYITGSIACQLFGLTYFKKLVSSYQSASTACIPLFFLIFIETSVIGTFAEGFKFDANALQSIVSGIFLFNPLTFSSMIRKNFEKKHYLLNYRLIIPFIVHILIHAIFMHHEIFPISSLYSIIIIYSIFYLATVNFSEYIISSPFSTSKSTIHFVFTIIFLFSVLYQYLYYSSTHSIYALSDSIYFLICIKSSLSELWKSISRKPTPQLSYGMGRISHIFSLSISIFAFFAIFNNIQIILFSNYDLKREYKSALIPPILFHILTLAFVAIYPRNSSSHKSVANAINFNAYKEQAVTINMPVIAEDLVSQVCSFIFLLSKNRTLDKILALVVIGVTIKLTLDSLKETISILICGTPNKIRSEMPEFCNEIKSIGFVVDTPVISAWQNDEFLLVGSAKINVQKDSVTNTQQFLLFIISKFQKLGILDVTAEIKGVEVDLPKYGKDAVPPNSFNTSSIPL